MTPPKRTAKKAAKKSTKKAPAKKAAKKAPAKKAAKKSAKKAPAKKAAKKATRRSAPKAAAPAAVMISKSRVKDHLKGKGLRSGDDVIAAVNAMVVEMLDDAAKRAEGNGRRTVRPVDF